ncbi:hypothetical protein [Arcobacter sp. YIC-80]|uniref:hypothetical protein n=1 Tax=unclassified Arcobacter TaxID=2593671 RepID=UPI00384D8442
MSEKLVLGPLLSLENDNKYVVCFLSKTNQKYSVFFDEKQVQAKKLGNLKFGYLYRAEITIPLSKEANNITYIIKTKEGLVSDNHKRKCWSFYIPSSKKKARLGIESYENFLNTNLLEEKDIPYSMLILNEFNLIDDEVLSQIKEIQNWSKDNLDDFFERLYIEKLGDEKMSLALASIPTMIMWHEPQTLKNEAFNSTSKKYFEIFQLRTIKNNTLLTKDRTHFSFALEFGGNEILALDNKNNSNTKLIDDYLEKKSDNSNLMIIYNN